MDLLVLQEIIYETKPEFIIETGTYKGGTALFFAHMLDILGKGKVITIDIRNEKIPEHPRIIRIIGSSIAKETETKVKEIVGDSPCMVFLDSAHDKQHVLAELEIYSKFVGIDCYLVVADTNLNGHPVLPLYAKRDDGKVTYGGPMEAVKEFLKKHREFVIDKSREKLYFTFFPSGFLRKVTKLEK